MFRLSLMLAVVLSFGFSQVLHAAEIGTHNYDIYVGDINGDGDSDFYFHGKSLVLILHGDIATPIVVPAPVSFVIYRDFDTYKPAEEYSLTSAQVATQVSAGTLTLYQNYHDFLIWNNGSSGLNNVLLRGSDSYAPALLLSSSTSNPFPLVVQTYEASGYSNISDRSLPITLQDINSDGKKDIVVGNFSSSKGEYAYIADSGGVPAVQYRVLTPSTDQPTMAGATHVGITAGTFRVDESGAATYGIPIGVAQGTAGVTPQISLNYSSSNSNGLAGQGWALGGLSAVMRCRQTLLQDGEPLPVTWSSQDRFCLDGQRLMLNSGVYGSPDSTYKTELDSSVLVTAKGGSAGHPAYFLAEARDGSTSVYGNTTNSKLTGTIANTTLTWSLNRFQDNVGNAIDFVYEGNGANGQRIKTIHYAFPTKNSSITTAARTDSAASVVFEYESRSDISEAYVAGHVFGMNQRLRRIRVINDGSELRRYNLSYMSAQTSDSRYRNNISRLQYIQECRQVDSVSLACLPGTTFNWGGGTHVALDQSAQVVSFPNPTNGKYVLNSLFGDVSGNGKLDLIYLMYETNHATSSLPRRAQVVVRLKYADSSNSSMLSLGVVDDYSQVKINNLDYNADGRQDLAVYDGSSWSIYLSAPRPDGTWKIDANSTEITALSFLTPGILFADVNSDGLVDAVYSTGYRLLKRNNEPNASSKAYSFGDFVSFQWDSVANFPAVNEGGTPTGTGLSNCVPSGYEPKVIPETMGDFNGDGVMDFIGNYSRRFSCKAAGSTTDASVLQDHFFALVFTQGKLKNYSQNKIIMTDIKAIDLNGDGLSDLVYRSGQNQINYRLNNGQGFNDPVVWVELPTYTSAPFKAVPQFLDFNGDGAIDIAWLDRVTSQMMVRLWGDTQSTVVRPAFGGKDSHLLMDVSGDGIVDYIKITSASLVAYHGVMAVAGAPIPCFYISTPAGQQCVGGNANPSDPVPNDEQHNAIIGIQNGLGGITKIVYGTLANSGHYLTTDVNATFTEHTYAAYCGGQPNCPITHSYTVANADNFYSRLNGGWDLPTGSTTLVSNNVTKGAPVLEVNGSINIVTEVQSSAPVASDINARSSVKYYYGEAKMQASGRGFLGFNRLKTIDQQTGVTTTTAYRQDFPFTGQPLATTIYSADGPAGKMLSYSENELDYKEIVGPDNTKRYQPFIKKSTEKSYALKNGGSEQGDLLQTIITETELYPDEYANPKNIKVTTADSLVSLIKNTYHEYGNSDWDKRMARLSRIEVTTNNDSANKRVSAFEYYGANEPGHLRGLLKKEIIEPGNTLSSTKTYTYDGFGNKATVSVTAVGSTGQNETRLVKTIYDAKGRYVQSTRNSLDQISTVDSINSFGAPTKVTDINNFSTNIFYDAMGREYMRKDATGAWARTESSYCGNGVSCPAGAIYRTLKSVAGGAVSIEYFDVLGRNIRSTTTSFDGRQVHVDTEYDNLGRIKKQSNPYYNGSAIEGGTIIVYDILGRVVKTGLPNNSEEKTEYTDNTIKSTNDLEQTRTETRNGLGQLIKVEDYIGGTIDYTYDIGGGLLSATTTADGVAVTVRMCYDKLGRKVAMHDPDKGGFDIGTTYKGKTNATKTCAEVAASASGTKLDGWWYYKYNGFGELISQTDTKGQTTTMTYDPLGRMKTRVDARPLSMDMYTRWSYDTDKDGVGSKGKLTEVFVNYSLANDVCQNGMKCHRTVYDYDQYSRLSTVEQFLPNESIPFISAVEYDRFGRAYKNFDALDKVILSGNLGLRSGSETYFNQYGYVDKTIDLATGKLLSQTLETNVFGSVKRELRGNGLVSNNVYDIKTGQLLNQQTGHGLNLFNIQDNEYRWDTIGNLKFRKNLSGKINTPVAINSSTGKKNLAESFCYDDLNRLTKTVAGASLNPNCSGASDVTYDGLGNITYKKGVGVYNYGVNAGPHAVTATNLNGTITNYTYDKNGNQLTGDGRTITYSAYDLPTHITRNGAVAEFLYGADRMRWQRTDTKNGVVTTTTYLGNVERIQRGNSIEWKRTVAGVLHTYKTDLNNVLQASDKRYVYNDHLGSLDLLTDANGEVPPAFSKVSHSMSFDPWGARRGGDTWGTFAVSTLTLTGFVHPVTTRGFTGHEMLDDMGLIHMNGRIYDPKLGRFLQADPFIQAAGDTQSYNRYSYVRNNPLNATDPSGFIFKKIHNLLKDSRRSIIRKSAKIFGAEFVSVVGSLLSGFCGKAAAICAAAWSYDFSRAMGATSGQAFGPAIIAGITRSFGQGMQGSGLGYWGQIGASALFGGVMAELQGGKFGHGFASAGLNGMFGGVGQGNGFSFGGMVASSIIGGTISEATGGKFKNGARSAAYSYAMSWGISKIGPGGVPPENKSGASSGASCSPNPINIATGEKYLTMTDYQAQGASQMTFERYYSSLAGEKASLGIGWRSNFDRALRIESVGDVTLRVVAVRHQGDPIVFYWIADDGTNGGHWETDNNRYESIRKTDAGWELQLTNNTSEIYSTEGRLLAIKHINGYQQLLTYGNSGNAKAVLLTVTDNFDQQLTFTYDLYARINSMTATDGSVTRYHYDINHNLTKVISPDETPENDWDNQYVVYDYEDPRFAHAITGIRNSQGQRIHSMAYDDHGRAVLSALGGSAERVDVTFAAGENSTKQSVVKNSLGKTTTYIFDRNNKPLTVQGNPTESCIGANQSYEYDDRGQVISKTDWNGSTTQYEYNDRGLEVLRKEAVDTEQERQVLTDWHNQWRLPSRIASADRVVEFFYNEQGLLVRRLERDLKTERSALQKLFSQYPEREWLYAHNAQGLLIEVDGPRSDVVDVTRFEYDTQGNRTAVINALGHRSETLAFNERGLPLQVRDVNGVLTELAYNARGWLITKTVNTEQGDNITRYDYTGVSDYSDQGLISAVTLPNGAQIHYEYDLARRLVAQSNNTGERIEYSLDLEGNRLEQRILNSTGALIFNQYQVFDELSRLLQSIGADGSITDFGYDKAGNLISSTDALGNNTAYAYDALNRLLATTDAMDGVVQNAYDKANRVIAVTDQRGLVTEYHYDGFGNKVAQISPDTGMTVYGYDQAGNLVSKKDARNVVTQYRYDAVSRITDVIYPAANDENIHYRYDNDNLGENGVGRVAGMTNSSGTQTYRYNSLGQLAEKNYDISSTHYSVGYDYDSAGQFNAIRYPSGLVVNYFHDAQGRLSSVNTTSPVDGATEQTIVSNVRYLPFGSLKNVTYGNGAQLRIDHDQNYRTRSIKVGNFAANDALYDRHYDYDSASNITAITDYKNTARNQVFNYDAIYRLTDATGSYGQISYSYDAVGNRVALEQNSRIEAYSYADNSNRLLIVITEGEHGELKTRSLDYDAVGNIIRDEVGGTAKKLDYSHKNRLQQVAITDKPTSSYEYNGKGQRVIKHVNGQVIHFHYDIADQLIAETQSSGQPIREYIYAVGQRLAMVDYTENPAGVIYYVVNDHLGTPQLLLDMQQQVVWSVDQSPFGEVNVTGGVAQPLRFPGQYADEETGYSYNYFRDYDPTLGRYIQSDPIGLEGGVNTYSYVKGNPIGAIDLWGLDSYLVSRPLDKPAGIFANHMFVVTHSTGPGTGTVWSYGKTTSGQLGQVTMATKGMSETTYVSDSNWWNQNYDPKVVSFVQINASDYDVASAAMSLLVDQAYVLGNGLNSNSAAYAIGNYSQKGPNFVSMALPKGNHPGASDWTKVNFAQGYCPVSMP